MNTARLSIAAAAALFSPGALGQDLGLKAPAQSAPIAVRHATIHPVSGPAIPDGTVVFSGGRVVAVGRDAEVTRPVNAVSVDATGRHLYPGLIAARTQLGMNEIGAVRATIDTYETGDATPEVRALAAVNADSTLIPVARSAGILTAGVFPSGGIVSGQPALIRLDGWTWEEMAVVPSLGVSINWPEFFQRDGAASADNLERIWREFEAYDRERSASPGGAIDVRKEAARSVLPGAGADQRRVFIGADDAGQISQAVAWSDRHGLRAVIVGGSAAPSCAEILARHHVPVIVLGVHAMPSRDDSPFDEGYTLPARLEAAGVEWCLASGEEAAHERSLINHASAACAYGLDPEAAVRSVTLSPAKILGVESSLGSIEPGKSATIIVTDGDLLEITTRVVRAYIDGREIDLANKQTRLADKYRERYRRMKEGK